MAKKKKKQPRIPQKLIPWIEAQERFRLTDAQVQMARELGMNPKKLGQLNNHHQEPWKAPLPQFIEHCYLKQFGKEMPDSVCSIEERARRQAAKKAAKKAARLERKLEESAKETVSDLSETSHLDSDVPF